MFIPAGFAKLTGAAGFAGFLGSLGFPAPLAVAYLVGLFELLAGLFIVVGFQTRITAYALAAFCIATAFIGHLNEVSALLKNFALAGGFLYLAQFGAFSPSIDKRSNLDNY
ncbi:DoxX family protein [Aureimonas fodinaquatilis]|uniref:DoxX family protein n=2 Tax=Aureimonas fodinaquatilis TaxID=2565783 RepID=A0A5B0E1X0_9HYPH|nr:DoxX family protein [Aureimonas fodinaquatilis]